MGSKLWSSDMIINDYLHPMIEDFRFGRFVSSCNLLYSLNNFLIGFGCGIKDLPIPLAKAEILQHPNVIARTSINEDYRHYYQKYFPALSKCIGVYLNQVLAKIAYDAGN